MRDLAGHASRALITVASYLDGARTGQEPELRDAIAYFRAASAGHADPASVAERGRQAGAALGDDPHARVAELAGNVLALVEATPDDALVTSPMGTMTLLGYLPTRTFELAVHTADLARALGVPLDVPGTAAAQALQVVADLAVSAGLAGPLLLAATGRPGLPAGFSVL